MVGVAGVDLFVSVVLVDVLARAALIPLLVLLMLLRLKLSIAFFKRIVSTTR